MCVGRTTTGAEGFRAWVGLPAKDGGGEKRANGLCTAIMVGGGERRATGVLKSRGTGAAGRRTGETTRAMRRGEYQVVDMGSGGGLQP